jgi:hypothetical protein
MVSKDAKTEKTSATTYDTKGGKLTRKPANRPVSGKAIADAKYANKAFPKLMGSGIIQSGKVVKGGNSELKEKLDKKGGE